MNKGYLEHLLREFHTPFDNQVLIFSVILFIILLAPLILGRFKIPGIIGLIIAGVIIGPYGLNLIKKDAAIDLFSTIGLLYIMFIAGLELDMNEFQKHKYKSLFFGFLTFIIPLGIGFPICYYLLNYDFNASLLTASMFSTHTLVAYPIVSKYGIAKNPAVAITVGGTILTDTAVLILLAVIVGSSAGTIDAQFWITLVSSLTIFSFIMFFIIPKVARWFFRKLESEKTSHYIFVLSVVFFAAFLSEIAGVEPIIGAFMAGLALNKLIPHSSTLMNRIEFTGNAIFIPFFLISVGMLVDVKVIFTGTEAMIIAAVLTITALVSKWLAAFVTQISFRYSKTQGKLIFGLSSAHAAATLAVIMVGHKAGILDDNILNGTIILILVVCVVASFVTEKAAVKLALSEADASDLGDQDHNEDEKILIPLTNPSKMDKILDLAILIRDKKSAKPLTVFSVVSNDNEAERNLRKSREELAQIVAKGSAAEVKIDTFATVDYNVSNGISRAATEVGANLLILGWPGKKASLLDKIVGVNELIELIIQQTNKIIFVCKFERPLHTHKRIVLVIPALSELEKGFATWVAKISRIGEELSLPCIIYANEKTKNAFSLQLSKFKSNLRTDFVIFNDWEEFLIIAKDILPEDLILMSVPRKGGVSYQYYLENAPTKLDKQFKENSKMVIYPQEFENQVFEEYEDMTSENINKGIDTIQKISKGLGSILKKQ